MGQIMWDGTRSQVSMTEQCVTQAVRFSDVLTPTTGRFADVPLRGQLKANCSTLGTAGRFTTDDQELPPTGRLDCNLLVNYSGLEGTTHFGLWSLEKYKL